MDGSVMSLFPSYSWFGVIHRVAPASIPSELTLRQVNHLAVLIQSGASSNRWVRCGRETQFNTMAGDVGFFAADDEMQTMVVRTDTSVQAFILAIPPEHLQSIALSDGLSPPSELQARPTFQNAIIQSALARLAASQAAYGITHSLEAEVAARSLIIRLVEILRGAPPDWHADSSVFDSRTMGTITDYVDAHLQRLVSLDELALLPGMSASHFAKKFRQSAGLSVQRFVNRRRLRAAMPMLETGSIPLSQVALTLGFSSQSHFTRSFGEMTGMTPARFRRQFGKA